MLHKKDYGDIASTHDLFLLKPFTDKAYVVPIAETQLEKIVQAAGYMQEELQNQRDWYWSCRGRSYFMEIIIALERMYGLIGYGVTHQKSDNTPIIKNAKLRDAVLYIESRFDEAKQSRWNVKAELLTKSNRDRYACIIYNGIL